MTELETALKSHDWSLAGYTVRPELDRLMRLHVESASALWEQYCPWSTANGGYIVWIKK
jgi:hypothetical protein